jgi:hypothetical protein
MPATSATGSAIRVTEVRSVSRVCRSSIVASWTPSACAVTRYGPPTRNPVTLNAPLALVVVDSAVPDGRCTIDTRPSGIGNPFAPSRKPDRLLVVSCALAGRHASMTTTAACSNATK